ncbi:hypothetical protein PHLCEN_2v1586 [Hermanssonia centrifuga]|uniref:Aldehyde dehydrogenase domain-containing protein n=1 Tax=Hermanssonia centrifuga TaxID=98765 RepID=A0A2R6RZH3_9APHY|nr:hypothetical protein PHLCEN_2v1586 [Hermanssonia centrifuga]
MSLSHYMYRPKRRLQARTGSTASSYDVRTTITTAQDTFQSGVWSKAPALQRSAVLSTLARIVQENVDAFAELESKQTGRTIREMKAQLSRLPEWL